MLTARPRVRISGRGTRLRVRKKSDRADSLALAKEACRVSIALDKMLAEALQEARTAGTSWTDIARSLHIQAGTQQDLIEGLGASRQAMLERQLRGAD